MKIKKSMKVGRKTRMRTRKKNKMGTSRSPKFIKRTENKYESKNAI